MDQKPFWELERSRIGSSRRVPVELIVNGNNITLYGLFVEHYQQFQVLWHGKPGLSLTFFRIRDPTDSWSAALEQILQVPAVWG